MKKGDERFRCHRAGRPIPPRRWRRAPGRRRSVRKTARTQHQTTRQAGSISREPPRPPGSAIQNPSWSGLQYSYAPGFPGASSHSPATVHRPRTSPTCRFARPEAIARRRCGKCCLPAPQAASPDRSPLAHQMQPTCRNNQDHIPCASA